MPLAPTIAAALTTPDTTRVLSVFAGGLDVTGDVKWDQFTVTDIAVHEVMPYICLQRSQIRQVATR